MTRVEGRLSDHGGGRTVTGFSRFVRLVFSDVSFVTRLRQGKVAGVLKFEHFVAPAGPSRVETSSKQLQTLGCGSDVGLQNLYRNKRGRKGMIPAARTHPGGADLGLDPLPAPCSSPVSPLTLTFYMQTTHSALHLKIQNIITLTFTSRFFSRVFTFIPQGGAHLKSPQAWWGTLWAAKPTSSSDYATNVLLRVLKCK